ncbi:MAG: peptigoglycan-binding protein LysM, partial [Oricola sp.]
MKKNTIAAWVFVAVVALVAIANAPGVSDRINGWLGKGPAPEVTEAQKAADTQPATTPEKPAEQAETEAPEATVSETGPRPAVDAQPAAEPQEGTKQATVGEVTIPTFDVVRVEPDGSTLIAGRAGTGAMVEVLSGTDSIAEATAGANGDFVAILTDPLAPGDYELVLRSTEQDGVVAMSTQTAIISVPEKGREGELLALVQEPGEPSRLINSPKPEAAPADQPAETVAATGTEVEPAAPPADAQAQGGQTEVATAPAGDAAPAAPAAQPASEIRIEAVEIDNGTVFVAGAAPAGSQVRVYANEILLGDTSASPNGRFLVEVRTDLPVGDYIIRADLIDPATAGVRARAA